MADSQVSHEIEIVTRKDALARGLKRYYTGKPCKNGHVDWRKVPGGSCISCNRENAAKRRKDPEVRAKQAAYMRERMKDPKVKQYMRDYMKDYKKNSSERQEKSRACIRRWTKEKMKDPEWVEKERERCRIKDAKRRKDAGYKEWHSEYMKSYMDHYYKNNPERFASYSRNRKARKRKAEGNHSAHDIKGILKRQNHKCVYCDADLRDGYHVDHIMPLVLGGSNWPDNIQCLCPRCNLSKGAKHPDDFAKEKGWL